MIYMRNIVCVCVCVCEACLTLSIEDNIEEILCLPLEFVNIGLILLEAVRF